MLNRDFARTSHDIGRVKMLIDQPHIKEQTDWGQVMSKFLTDYKNQQNEAALTEALQSGDEDAINQAAAAYNPQGQLDYIQRIKQAREIADYNHNLNMAMQDRRAELARELAQIRANGNGLVNINMGTNGETPADVTQQGLDALQGVIDRDSIGAWTRFRKGLKLTTDQEERDLGAVSGAIAAIAPEAISKLKAAGVSGINTMAEFLTYLGLPENPTSQELAGAMPLITSIVGKSVTAKPEEEKTKEYYANKYGF